MAGIRYPPEDPDLVHPARAPPPAAPPAAADLISDDDRSVAADSWSIKSEYGSTLDDEQRHVDAAEVLSSSTLRAFSDYSSDKDEPDANEVEPSMLGLQSYWDSAYAEDLANFQEHGHAGEVWFGVEVMGIVTDWTKNLCTSMARGQNVANDIGIKHDSGDDGPKDLSSWSVLDIGTGNGLLLQELAKQGFSDLTGTDYSEGAIDLARSLAARDEFSFINFVVDDVLDSKLERQFHLVMDKGTLDAIGLHPEGPMKRFMYWESMSKLVAPGGLLVITSCNSTKDELVQEVESFNQRSAGSQEAHLDCKSAVFQYFDHIRTYPTFVFGGVEGSRVATVAFLRH
uniref:Protein-lysine N-methyltransferase g.60620 n=2 Tax=Anthurium amnicola TaxID=1678845 RepID=A0A1D1XRM4_9ARAE